ncbi:hypothetical protein PHLCEN_2v9567 [Hermanssonia centrifuga]|uniref:Uncharacterized protein n=1 Tax=Hermanssonia centrifuga TaxID=98765 RepID=A0A2R6NQE9_9APHY|nr:hypothetical protein PHLCEN_2v9567 [Hermanssonia centrifuga]
MPVTVSVQTPEKTSYDYTGLAPSPSSLTEFPSTPSDTSATRNPITGLRRHAFYPVNISMPKRGIPELFQVHTMADLHEQLECARLNLDTAESTIQAMVAIARERSARILRLERALMEQVSWRESYVHNREPALYRAKRPRSPRQCSPSPPQLPENEDLQSPLTHKRPRFRMRTISCDSLPYSIRREVPIESDE